MPLLTICQNVMSETGWPVPTVIASSQDVTARQIMSLAKTELRTLSELFNWPHLSTDFPINTINGTATYLFPTDFRVLDANSAFHTTQYYDLKGSVGIKEWEYRKNGLLGQLDRWAFRLYYTGARAGVELTPTPTSVEALVTTYFTSNFAYAADGVTPQATYILDGDISRIPEQYVELGLKWRFRRAKGLDYSAELDEYNATIKGQFSKLLGQADIPVGGRRANADWPLTQGYVPDTGFGV